MDEQIVVAAFSDIASTLGALALAALDFDDPLAFPEPPPAEEINAYATRVTALQEQIAESYHPLLAASLRDYKAGFPDRAGIYLTEILEKLMAEPTYTQAFSPASQSKLATCLKDLKEV